jgi:hypothetical protein
MAASGRSGRPPRQHSPDQGVGLRAQLLPCSPSLVGPPPRLEVGCRRNRPLLVRHAAAAIGQQRLQELRTRLAWLYLRQPQALPAAGAGSGSRQRQLPPRYVRDHHDQATRVARSRMVMPDARSSTSSSALIRRVSGLRRLQPRHRGVHKHRTLLWRVSPRPGVLPPHHPVPAAPWTPAAGPSR